jgi:hypothetical protein
MIKPTAENLPQAIHYRYWYIELFLIKLVKMEAKAQLIESAYPCQFCTLCREHNNEKEDYVINISVENKEGEVRWSKGLYHYYSAHGVVPSRQFYDTIMAYSLKDKREATGKKQQKDRDKARHNIRDKSRREKYVEL